MKQSHNTAANNQHCISESYLCCLYTVHHAGYRLNDTRFFRSNVTVLKQTVWRNQKIFTESAHASIRKARKMCTVVKMLTALFISGLTVITASAGKCYPYNHLIPNAPFVPVYFVSHLFNMSCNLMSSDERELYFVDSCINPLLPCADCRCIDFNQDLIS